MPAEKVRTIATEVRAKTSKMSYPEINALINNLVEKIRAGGMTPDEAKITKDTAAELAKVALDRMPAKQEGGNYA